MSEAGLVGLNASLERPGLPRRVALVTSIASAACEDVMAVFDRSGLGIDLVRVDTRVQGATAPAAIARALRRAVSAGADLILLVRGGGSTTDLAAFDDREVALAVAHSPVPVITGIGHDVDSSIADVVAHERAPTPTAAAQLLVEWMERDLAEIEDCWERVVHSAVNDLRGADERLMRLGSRASTGARTGLESEQRRMERAARSLITLSSAVLDKGERRCERLALEVRSAAREHLATEVAQLNDLTARLGRSARSALTRLATDLDAVETEVAALDPRRMLDRGWSITRLADGSVLTDPTQAEPGALLVTRVRYGSVSSTVTPDTHNANEDAP